MDKIKNQIIEEFDKKFVSPKSLWVQDNEGNWYDKKDIKSFLSTALDTYRENLIKQIKAKTIIEPKNDYWDYFRKFLNSFSK